MPPQHIDGVIGHYVPFKCELPSVVVGWQSATKVRNEAKSPHDNTIVRGCDPKVLAKIRTDVFDIPAPKP